MFRFASIIFLLIALFSCNEVSKTSPQKSNLPEISKGSKGTILIFYSYDCPMCDNYSTKIKELLTYKDFKLNLIIPFPESKDSIEFQLNSRGINASYSIDSTKRIVKKYGATIVPEVILLDSVGTNIYQGSIDNWMFETGEKRIRATLSYIDSAIAQYLIGKEIKIPRTKAYGCFIE